MTLARPPCSWILSSIAASPAIFLSKGPNTQSGRNVAHHIARAPSPEDLRTLYQGVIVYNPGNKPVTLDILQAASYLSQPDAPFIELPPQVDNSNSNIYAGPGSRAVNDILRGRRQSGFEPGLIIPPGKSELLMNHPIPVRGLVPPLNGRSTLMRLHSDGRGADQKGACRAMGSIARAAGYRGPGLGKWRPTERCCLTCAYPSRGPKLYEHD